MRLIGSVPPAIFQSLSKYPAVFKPVLSTCPYAVAAAYGSTSPNADDSCWILAERLKKMAYYFCTPPVSLLAFAAYYHAKDRQFEFFPNTDIPLFLLPLVILR